MHERTQSVNCGVVNKQKLQKSLIAIQLYILNKYKKLQFDFSIKCPVCTLRFQILY